MNDLQPPSDEIPVDTFPAPTGACDDKWIEAKWERDKQRKDQRGWLFITILFICIIFYGGFVCGLFHLDIIVQQAKEIPYVLILWSLLGLTPTVLLLALMKSVYRSTKEAGSLLGIADEFIKSLSAIAQQLIKK